MRVGFGIIALAAGFVSAQVNAQWTTVPLPSCGMINFDILPTQPLPDPPPSSPSPAPTVSSASPPTSILYDSNSQAKPENCDQLPPSPLQDAVEVNDRNPAFSLANRVLIVPSGAVVELPAQRWDYDQVEIQKRRCVKGDAGGTNVLDLHVRGSLILHGTIEARDFDTMEQAHTGTAPDGTPIRLEFRNRNRGGAGGDGGNSSAQLGGRGAQGTVGAGGGGGGGAVDFRGVPRIVANGIAAIDERGAPSLPVCGRAGGDAGRRTAVGNGGVVILRVQGDFDGSGGIVDVRGSDGAAGSRGYPRTWSGYGCQAGECVLEAAQMAAIKQTRATSIIVNCIAHYETSAGQPFTAPMLLGLIQDIDAYAENFKQDDPNNPGQRILCRRLDRRHT